MSDNKTRKTRRSVKKFLDAVEPERRREDARVLAEMMEDVTGEKPAMWGDSIVGFGDHHYVYESGREGDWFEAGFSPRKSSLSLYLTAGFKGGDALMKKLGKHKTGASCVYINKLDDVDLKVLRRLIEKSVEFTRRTAAEREEAS